DPLRCGFAGARISASKGVGLRGGILQLLGRDRLSPCSGRPAAKWVAPLSFLVFTVLSRVLLPAAHTRLPGSILERAGLMGWLIPVLLLAGLAIFSLATLPTGSP